MSTLQPRRSAYCRWLASRDPYWKTGRAPALELVLESGTVPCTLQHVDYLRTKNKPVMQHPTVQHIFQILGVHLGFRQHEHDESYGHPYNPKTFGEVVKAVQEEDAACAAPGGVPTLESTCPKAFKALVRHLEHD